MSTGKEIAHFADESNSAAYQRKHRAMRKIRGLARDKQCVDCDKQASDWSQVHGTDGTDAWNHYEPRCRSCHQKYDVTDERRRAVGDMYRGKKHTAEARLNMSLAHEGKNKKDFCIRGHDLNAEGVRNKFGQCEPCVKIRREEKKAGVR